MTGDDLQESDRLYRFRVPERPELNQMHTAINMGGNDINNAGNLNGQKATVKGDITSEDGWFITRNNKGVDEHDARRRFHHDGQRMDTCC